MFSAFGVSDAGPVRKTNEDRFAADERLQLMVVADGMGGHLAGDVASSLAVDTITGFVRRSEEEGECSWPYGIDPDLSFCSNRLRTAIHLANRRVFRAAEKYDDYTAARDAFFKITHTRQAPWFVVDANDQKRARLNMIAHLLEQLPDQKIAPEPLKLPPLKRKRLGKDKLGAKASLVPERY